MKYFSTTPHLSLIFRDLTEREGEGGEEGGVGEGEEGSCMGLGV